MKVQLASDLHLELLNDSRTIDWSALIKPAAPVLAICGDVGRPGSHLLRSLLEFCSHSFELVLLVRGNHDYYAVRSTPATPDEIMQQFREETARFGNVKLLERESVEWGGVTFHGCTLWSDIPDKWKNYVGSVMSDTARIMFAERAATVHDLVAWHERDAAWLAAQVRATRGPQVVLTHHLPVTCQELTPAAYWPPSAVQCAYSTDDVWELARGTSVKALLCGALARVWAGREGGHRHCHQFDRVRGRARQVRKVVRR